MKEITGWLFDLYVHPQKGLSYGFLMRTAGHTPYTRISRSPFMPAGLFRDCESCGDSCVAIL
jgi:hypothetical protein